MNLNNLNEIKKYLNLTKEHRVNYYKKEKSFYTKLSIVLSLIIIHGLYITVTDNQSSGSLFDFFKAFLDFFVIPMSLLFSLAYLSNIKNNLKRVRQNNLECSELKITYSDLNELNIKALLNFMLSINLYQKDQTIFSIKEIEKTEKALIYNQNILKQDNSITMPEKIN